MPKESRINWWALFWVAFTILVAQLPSGYMFYKISEMRGAIAHYNDILTSGVVDNADIEFIAQLKKEAGFNQDIQILIGPYRRLYGNSFKYRLEQHLVLVEQSQTTKETFLILFDKTFYNELSREKRKGVLAHEIWHIFNLAKRLIRPSINEERDADNYAIRYVSIETMLEFCRKYEGDDFMREIRVENLEKQRLIPKPPETS